MEKVVSMQEVSEIIKPLVSLRRSIVLAGGCFDILHIGHIRFLKEAKKLGGILIVLLESDKTVKKLKGVNRPVFTQKERAEVLCALSFVDHVVLLPKMKNDQDYHDVIAKIRPQVIALTKHDPYTEKKRKHADAIGAKIITVPHVKTFSSSTLAKLIGID